MAQSRKRPERESVEAKRVSGASGDGRTVCYDGESLREGENQEGIGLTANLKGGSAGLDSQRDQSREGNFPGCLRGVMNLEG